jgi:hypothetical protein
MQAARGRAIAQPWDANRNHILAAVVAIRRPPSTGKGEVEIPASKHKQCWNERGSKDRPVATTGNVRELAFDRWAGVGGHIMPNSFSFSFDNRGKLGQAVSFNPDNDRNGLWIEGSDFPGGESGGIFMNGNVTCIWSPGDNDLLRVLDEDSFPTGTPVFTITNDGRILQRGTQIHADHVFEPDYELESIEEHTAFMTREKHLSAVPKARRDEKNGQDIVEYNSLMRGLLEELEKAHLYIAKISEVVKEQRKALAMLSARVDAVGND